MYNAYWTWFNNESDHADIKKLPNMLSSLEYYTGGPMEGHQMTWLSSPNGIKQI